MKIKNIFIKDGLPGYGAKRTFSGNFKETTKGIFWTDENMLIPWNNVIVYYEKCEQHNKIK